MPEVVVPWGMTPGVRCSAPRLHKNTGAVSQEEDFRGCIRDDKYYKHRDDLAQHTCAPPQFRE